MKSITSPYLYFPIYAHVKRERLHSFEDSYFRIFVLYWFSCDMKDVSDTFLVFVISVTYSLLIHFLIDDIKLTPFKCL